MKYKKNKNRANKSLKNNKRKVNHNKINILNALNVTEISKQKHYYNYTLKIIINTKDNIFVKNVDNIFQVKQIFKTMLKYMKAL